MAYKSSVKIPPVKTLLILLAYFLVASSALALVFLPGLRALAVAGLRKGSQRVSDCVRAWDEAGRRGLGQTGEGGREIAGAMARWLTSNLRRLALALCVLLVVPSLALLWQWWQGLETFDHTDVRMQNERVAELLAGERLVPPAPLPPAVFTTREVEQVRPAVRFASRDWALLDEEFAQRLLVVYRLMLEQHGYEMVLLEGYRSPQRQEQLAALGGQVTQAVAFRSYHQFGLAADSAFLRDGKIVISERDPWAMRGYELYGAVAQSVGLVWGGGWRSLKDFGHAELRRPGVLQRGGGEVEPKAGYVY